MYRQTCLLLLLYTATLHAQVVRSPSSDLQGAKKISVNKIYSFSDSPVGSGSIMEFAINPKRNPIIFKEERNSVWFRFTIPYEGELTFTILPHNINDDYDWMLFADEEGLKDMLQNETAKPLRSNNARNEKNLNSETGLKDGFTSTHVIPGPNESFCRPLTVKKGDKLALIIDNIYNGGNGFDISISLKPALSGTIEGIVKAKRSGIPLRAEIVLEDDSTGTLISKTVSDVFTGKYSIEAPLNWQVNLTATNIHYLFSTTDVILNDTTTQKINFDLDTIKSGNKLVFFNIHFLANRDEILANSKPDLERLTAFLKSNPTWTVRIVGHTNNNVFAEARYLQRLSFDRAIAVKNYLLKNAIPEKRISCTGLGGKNPIITTKDPELGMKNLRVEVVLIGK